MTSDDDYRKRMAGDARVLRDIERMENLMTAERSWAHCVGCDKLRSTLDSGLCVDCRAKGIRTRQRPKPAVVERIVHAPAPDTFSEWIEGEDGCDLCHDLDDALCVCGRDDRPQEEATVVDITPLEEPEAAERKQRPVKRRWWKPRR